MKNRNSLFSFLILLIFFCNNIFAQSNNYSKVKVTLENESSIGYLQELDLGLDHFHTLDDQDIEFIIPSENIVLLDNSGLSYEVIIQDYRAAYQERRIKELATINTVPKAPMTADLFGYGSMGGFYTLEEIEQKLDTMHLLFPTLVTPKYSIGTSIEGRDIWAIKISDNPMMDEPEEAVYYDALHHSREPLSMAVTMNFAFWLLENYETNEKVKYIIDHREIYIVPCVNPDGYEWNRITDPNGGGLWRKNRRDVGSCTGVDLNRNYSFGYAYDNSCASTNACSETYRGEDAFSEPESNAVKDFLALINPNTALSIHSTWGTCLMPYGYDTSPPAYPIYSQWATDFLSENDYTYGVTYQMLGYTSCGTTRSYLHSEGVHAWTLEIGGTGFWPNQSTIFDLVDENVYPLFYQAWIAGQYTDVQSHEIIGAAIQGESFEMNVEVKNKGFGATPSNVEVAIISNNTNVVVSGDGAIGMVPSFQTAISQNFNIAIDPLLSEMEFELTIVVSQDGTETNRETIIVPVGDQVSIFEDDAENGMSNWTSSGNGIAWGICADDSYGGSFSFADSDNSNSQNNTTNFFTLTESLDLSATEKPMLEFYSKWSLENGDNVYLEISSDGGNSWSSIQNYDGTESWQQQLFDLTDYISSDVKIRFRMQTDFSEPGDGFYFDKISIVDYQFVDPTDVAVTEINNNSFTYFPNPVDDILNIELVESTTILVKIFDTKGTLIKKAQSTSSLQLDVGNLLPNIYIIQVMDLNSGDLYSDKLMKI